MSETVISIRSFRLSQSDGLKQFLSFKSQYELLHAKFDEKDDTELKDDYFFSEIELVALAFLGNVAIGYITLHRPESHGVAVYGSTYVEEKYRKQGIFNLMLNDIEANIAKSNIKAVEIHPIDDDDWVAALGRRGYERLDDNTTYSVTLRKSFQKNFRKRQPAFWKG